MFSTHFYCRNYDDIFDYNVIVLENDVGKLPIYEYYINPLDTAQLSIVMIYVSNELLK